MEEPSGLPGPLPGPFFQEVPFFSPSSSSRGCQKPLNKILLLEPLHLWQASYPVKSLPSLFLRIELQTLLFLHVFSSLPSLFLSALLGSRGTLQEFSAEGCIFGWLELETRVTPLTSSFRSQFLICKVGISNQWHAGKCWLTSAQKTKYTKRNFCFYSICQLPWGKYFRHGKRQAGNATSLNVEWGADAPGGLCELAPAHPKAVQ